MKKSVRNFAVEKKTCKSDPFTIRDGHYVAHDGFVVPKDFEEFYERFPDYVRKWVSKHGDRFATSEDLEDWMQDLLVHLCSLPQASKHREGGKEDVVQVFDPVLHYGANEARFRNYINRCLANKLSTMRSKRMKDALCSPGNLSLDGQTEGKDLGGVGDEYCHSHSAYLQDAAKLSEKQAHDRTRVQQFENFIWRKAPKLFPVVRAIKATRNDNEAAALLGVTLTEFRRLDSRLVRLGHCFSTGEPLPKQRKPYRRRVSNTKHFPHNRMEARNSW
jgi:hypothetical protein